MAFISGRGQRTDYEILQAPQCLVLARSCRRYRTMLPLDPPSIPVNRKNPGDPRKQKGQLIQ
jgi:hypothetical protein